MLEAYRAHAAERAALGILASAIVEAADQPNSSAS